MNRQPELRIAHSRDRKLKPSRQDAHDGAGLAVNGDRSTEDISIRSEPASPQAIAQNDRVRAAGLALFGKKIAAKRRLHTQNGEHSI